MTNQFDAGCARLIEAAIEEFWESRANTLGFDTPEKAWGEPHLGYARGDDPLFTQIKSDIGPFYWTPAEAFAWAFPESPVAADSLSVVSWVLPQTDLTKRDQRFEETVPAERWARARDFGEDFNFKLRLHIASTLTEAGIPSVAPECLPEYSPRQRSERFGLASNWSERHVAWIAGLGTFGLSDGLITKVGKAVRFGSVVVAATLPPTPRPYTDHQDWCLWFARGTCGACVRRCPAGAITEEGHDKEKCLDYIFRVATPHASGQYGTGATPCGLCQVGIPCESRIPSGLPCT